MFIVHSSQQISPKWFVKSLAALAFFALAIRLAAILLIPTQPVSDFWSLFTRAINLHDIGIYEAITGRPDASFPPLYPIVLSASFSIPVDRLFLSKLFNVVLGTIAVVLITELVNIIAGPKVGITAGLIQAFYPRSVLMPVLLAAENLLIPILFLWTILVVHYFLQNKNSIPSLIVIGIVSGFLTLTRSITYLLWLIIPLITLIKGRPFSTVVKEFVLLAFISNLVLLPWGIRNLHVLGRFTPLNSVGGVDLFIGNNPNSTGEYYAWQIDILHQDPLFFQRGILDQDAEASQFALQWIKDYPIKAVHLYVIKFTRMFFDERYVEDFAISYGLIEPPWPAAAPLPLDHPLRQYSKEIVIVLNSVFYAVLLLELAGITLVFFIKWTRPSLRLRWTFIALLIAGFYFPVLSAVFLAVTRYRWPFTDILIPFAAYAIISLESVFVRFSYSLQKKKMMLTNKY